MSEVMKHKLQKMLSELPQDGIATTKWLRSKGIYSSLVHRYVKSGWLKMISHGAYCRPHDNLSWLSGIKALQSQLGMPVYIGGKAALVYHGHGHFIAMRYFTKDIFYSHGNKPPKWFRTISWDDNLRISQLSIIKGEVGLEPLMIGTTKVLASSRERAVLELLHLAPRYYDYEEVKLIMEAMGTLRPKLLRELLSQCSSEKARRLLLYFGEMMGHSWRKYLEDFLQPPPQYLLKIIAKGGHYEAKFNLFIPSEYVLRKEVNVRF